MTYVSGASLYATREFVDEVGLMDERYFLYCDDVDWCLRARPMQLRYAHDSIVSHKHGTTIGSHKTPSRRSAMSVYLTERNKLLLTKKFYHDMYPIIVIVTLGLLIQYGIQGAWSNAGIALRGWLAGVRGEFGPPPLGPASRKHETIRYTA